MTSQVILRLQDGGKVAPLEATRVQFSAHQLFANADAEALADCLRRVGEHLSNQDGLALYGDGPVLEGLLRHCRALLSSGLIKALVSDDPARPRDESSVSAVPAYFPATLPLSVSTVFLCETRAFQRQQMRKRLPDRLRVIDLDILTEIAADAIPALAWVPTSRHIYPVDVPEIRFRDGLDMLLMDCPARNLALMPNGLGYVHNALKKTSINFQTFDLDIVTYHRYHIRRIFDEGGVIVLPSGREMPLDPWQAENYDLWGDPKVVDYFMPIIEAAAAEVIRARPKILGLSIQQCSEVFSRALVKRVKAALPDTVIIVGGFSCYNADIGLRGFPEADYMCIGESDLTVGPLVEALARGERPRDLAGVLSHRDTPGRLFAPAPMPHNLDQIEFPKYEWCDLSLYRNYNGYQLVPIIASRGCRWSRCTFCAERFYWRIRSAKNFVEELQWLFDQGCTLFMFNESDLNGMPDKLLGICDEIINSGLKVKLTGQLRINKKSDRPFFDKLRAAGFVALRFGIDAFSENTLRLQKKGYTTAMVSQNLKDCWESGIYTEINWVIGIPGETEQDCDEGVDLLLRNRMYIGRLANINPLILVNGGVYWIDPDAHNIQFRTPKEELYARFPRALPADQWFSTEPYIDAKVRRDRFNRIVLALHDAGFPVGTWAARVIDDVRTSRDRLRAGAGDAATAKPEPTERLKRAAPAADKGPPRLVRAIGSHNVVAYAGRFYALPHALGDMDIQTTDISKMSGVIVKSTEAEIVAALTPRTKANTPRLVRSMDGHNIVALHGRFYGIPQSLGEHDLTVTDPATLPGVITADTEAEVVSAIEAAIKWANSRGHLDEQRDQQRKQGAAYRVDSALGDPDRPEPLQPKPFLVRFAGQFYAIAPESLAALSAATPGENLIDKVLGTSLADSIRSLSRRRQWHEQMSSGGRPPGERPSKWAIAADAGRALFRDLIGRFTASSNATPALAPVPIPESSFAIVSCTTKGATPDLIATFETHNVVEFDGLYYGLPRGLSVDWESGAIDRLAGVITATTARELMGIIRERFGRADADTHSVTLTPEERAMGPARDNTKVPMLVGVLESYNIVAYEGWIYGIPQSAGAIDLSEVDAFSIPGVIRDVSRDVVEGEIRERLAAERVAA